MGKLDKAFKDKVWLDSLKCNREDSGRYDRVKKGRLVKEGIV